MLALAQAVSAAFGGGVAVKYRKSEEKEYLTDNPSRRCPDLAKIKKLVGYSPRVRLAEGLAKQKSWYESQM
jgi:nucleoside-diphosphate-sugar epimerase